MVRVSKNSLLSPNGRSPGHYFVRMYSSGSSKQHQGQFFILPHKTKTRLDHHGNTMKMLMLDYRSKIGLSHDIVLVTLTLNSNLLARPYSS